MVVTSDYIWMDGKFIKWDDAKVHVLTHSLHYGSAVFEGIHSYKTGKGTVVFRLDEHLERLFFSANSLGMSPGFTKEQINSAIRKLIDMNSLGDAYIRPLVYYGYGSIGVYPKDIPTDVLIVAVPWNNYYSKELSISTSRFERYSERSTVFGAKISGNYANSILAMHEARKKGYDEALMLDNDGYVSEGPVQNIFLVKDEDLITPMSRSALYGITRDSIMEISKESGIKTYEKKVTLDEIRKADELFFCGTASEIAPIISVDDIKIGNGNVGQITSKIRDMFYDIVRGNNQKFIKWLTYTHQERADE